MVETRHAYLFVFFFLILLSPTERRSCFLCASPNGGSFPSFCFFFCMENREAQSPVRRHWFLFVLCLSYTKPATFIMSCFFRTRRHVSYTHTKLDRKLGKYLVRTYLVPVIIFDDFLFLDLPAEVFGVFKCLSVFAPRRTEGKCSASRTQNSTTTPLVSLLFCYLLYLAIMYEYIKIIKMDKSKRSTPCFI